MRSPQRRLAAVFASLLLPVAAACSGGTTPVPGSASASAGAGTTPGASGAANIVASPTVSLTIGSVANFNGVPFAVAKSKGFFANHGLDVTVQTFAAGDQLRSALLGGSLDAILSGTTSTIPVYQANNGVRITSALTGSSDELIMSTALQSSLGTGLANVSALKGKTIAVNAAGSLSDNDLRTFLKAQNLAPDSDVKIVAVGSGTAQLQALEAGQVDGFIGAEPGGAQAEHDGKGYVMLNFSVDPVYPDAEQQAGLVVVFGAKWMTGDQTVAKAFTQAIGEAIQAVRADPNVAIDAVSQMLPTLDKSVLAQAANTFDKSYRVAIPQAGWDSLMTQALGAGIIKATVPYDSIVAPYQDIWALTDK